MAKAKQQAKKSALEQAKTDQAKGSASAILEELFNDFHRNRKDIYVMNLVRGIFFGFGSVIGGTLVIALLVWILSLFRHTWLGPLVRSVNEALQQPGVFL